MFEFGAVVVYNGRAVDEPDRAVVIEVLRDKPRAYGAYRVWLENHRYATYAFPDEVMEATNV